jgi:hypothetical protein
MASGLVKDFHVTRLKMFHGSKEAGRAAAMLDADEYEVQEVLAWKGCVEERSYMWFKLKFSDGEVVWKEWDKDMDNLQAYGDFIQQEAPLFMLRFPVRDANKQRTWLRRTEITSVVPGDTVYVDLRRWGEAWYDQLGLEDAYETIHVVECSYRAWNGRGRKKINIHCMIFDENLTFDAYEVYCWGTIKRMSDKMTLIDERFVRAHPEVLPDDPVKRATLIERYNV